MRITLTLRSCPRDPGRERTGFRSPVAWESSRGLPPASSGAIDRWRSRCRCAARSLRPANLTFAISHVGPVIQKDIARCRRNSHLARVVLSNRRCIGLRVDEEQVVLCERADDIAHDAGRRRLCCPRDCSRRVRAELPRDRSQLARRLRVAHLGGDFPGARIESGERLHRKMQHHAFPGIRGFGGDLARIRNVGQDRERQRISRATNPRRLSSTARNRRRSERASDLARSRQVWRWATPPALRTATESPQAVRPVSPPEPAAPRTAPACGRRH